MPRKPTPLIFPVGGLNEDAGYTNQVPLTTTKIENVRSHDPIEGRLRGGSRPGMEKFYATQINSDAAVQSMLKVVEPQAYQAEAEVFLLAAGGAGSTTAGAIDGAGAFVFEYDTGGVPLSLSRDATGDYYVSGFLSSTWTGNDGSDQTVWKVLAAGTVQWTFYGGAFSSNQSTYDPVNDRVYVTGTRTSDWTGGAANADLWCLNATTGAVVWTIDFSAGTRNVAVDSSGNIFVVGGRNSGWPGASGVTANAWKVDSTGAIVGSYNTAASLPNAIDIDSAGQVLIGQDDTTTTWDGNDGSAKNIFLLSNALASPPTNTFNIHSGGSLTSIKFMASDYVASGSTVSAKDIRKFNSAGTVLWDFFATLNTSQGNAAVTINMDDNVVVCMQENSSWDGATGAASFLVLDGSDGSVLTSAAPAEIGSSINQTMRGFKTKQTSAASLSTRDTSLIVAAGGTIKRIDTDGVLTTPTSGADAMTAEPYRIQMAQLFSKVFMVDGTNSKYYDLATDAMIDWATTVTGQDPAGDSLPANCRLLARYRGRAVLAGQVSDPHNWFMSKAGDPFDFDYSPATLTAIQAVAGNNAQTGLVGDIITALMPFSDDAMLIGGDSSLWQMSGDPAAGGSIDLLSDKIGVAWNAWTQDPNGSIYFLGVDGIYKSDVGVRPLKITANRLDERFKALDLTTTRVLMEWDFLRQGLVLISANLGTGTVQTAFFYDIRSDSWSTDVYPTAMGPSSIYGYDSEDPDDVEFLLGCKDGYIRNAAPTAADDDGTAMTSTVRYSPVPLTDGFSEEVLTHVNAVLGEGSGSVTMKIYAGQSAEQVADATTPRYVRTLSAGQNTITTHPVRARWIQIELVATAPWAMENLSFQVQPSGQRGRLRL